jgi:hypothetical protein
MTHGLVRASLLLQVLLLIAGGCAHDLAHASSGAIGCAPKDIAIAEVAVSWSTTSWRASCRGVVFQCAGEGAPQCVPTPPVAARSQQ